MNKIYIDIPRTKVFRIKRDDVGCYGNGVCAYILLLLLIYTEEKSDRRVKLRVLTEYVLRVLVNFSRSSIQTMYIPHASLILLC